MPRWPAACMPTCPSNKLPRVPVMWQCVQAGDSFDLATLACSLLAGAGYNAYVAVGYVPRQVALNDLSRTDCPWLEQHGLEAPAYAELAPLEPEPSAEAEPTAPVQASEGDATAAEGPAEEPAAAEQQAPEGPDAAEAGASADGPAGEGEGHIAAHQGAAAATEVPLVQRDASGEARAASSRPGTGAAALSSAGVAEAPTPAAAEGPHPAGEGAAEQPAAPSRPCRSARPRRYVHAFVLVKPGRREVAQAVLLDPVTGVQHSMDAAPCTGIEFVWSAANFWINLQCSSAGGLGGASAAAGDAEAGAAAAASGPGLAELAVTDWTLSNPNCWLPLLVHKEVGAALLALCCMLHATRCRQECDSGGWQLHLAFHSVLSESPPSLQDHLLETGTVATHLSMHSMSKSSDLLLRPQGGAGPTRSSALLERLSSLSPSKSFSPRSPQAQAGASAASLTAGAAGGSGPGSSSTAAAAAAAVAGSTLGGHRVGLGLQHLTMGARNGTPRLGGSLSPTRDLLDPSMAYLSPDESSMLRSSATLAPAGGGAGTGGAGSSQGQYQAQAAGPLPTAPEMPLSWVPGLSISRERLDSRCPRGHKAVQYRQARREVFAGIGECARWDGLVRRHPGWPLLRMAVQGSFSCLPACLPASLPACQPPTTSPKLPSHPPLPPADRAPDHICRR